MNVHTKTPQRGARAKAAALTARQIDRVIRRNLEAFRKPGVVSVRPGVRIVGGMLTHEPAIVVSVRRKLKTLPASEMLPKKVEDVPVDVRPLTPMEALRAADPEAFAQELADIPRGNVPVEMQTANMPLERNLKGRLIGPMVDRAVARVRPRRPGEQGRGAPRNTYSKLPASTFAPITDTFTVTCFASPDAGWPTLQPFLQGVTSTLTVGMYEFTAPHIVDTVSGQMKGKTLNLVLDDPTYDTTHREQTDDETYGQLKKALGATGFNFAWAAEGSDRHNKIHLFPGAYHIKVAVADSASVFLSSGNFNSSNQPDIDPIHGPATDRQKARMGDRDWHVVIKHDGLSRVFEQALLRDLQQALPGQQAAPPPRLKMKGKPPAKAYPGFFPAKVFTEHMTVQPALTPDNYADVLLPLLSNCQTSFWMQTQYIKPSSKFADDVNLPPQQKSVLENLIASVADLISRNLDVRIIVSTEVSPTMLEHLQEQGGLEGTMIRRQDHVHNKGMLIDGRMVVVGSQNWSTEGVDTNRDASVVIESASMASYWSEIFESDWNNLQLKHEDPAE